MITADFQSNARNSTADAGWEELDVKAVLEKVNARRVALQSNGVRNFEKEPLWVGCEVGKGEIGVGHARGVMLGWDRTG